MCTLAKEVEFVQFLSDMKRFNIYFSVCVHWAEVQFVKFWPDVKKTQYLFLRECTLGKEVQFVQLCSDLKRFNIYLSVCVANIEFVDLYIKFSSSCTTTLKSVTQTGFIDKQRPILSTTNVKI